MYEKELQDEQKYVEEFILKLPKRLSTTTNIWDLIGELKEVLEELYDKVYEPKHDDEI